MNFKIVPLINQPGDLVLKIILPPRNGEVEHSYHILINAEIKRHPHFDRDNISEGYREIDINTGEPLGEWEVVGAGMRFHFHGVPYKDGIRIIEGSKRGPGIQSWPELQKT